MPPMGGGEPEGGGAAPPEKDLNKEGLKTTIVLLAIKGLEHNDLLNNILFSFTLLAREK